MPETASRRNGWLTLTTAYNNSSFKGTPVPKSNPTDVRVAAAWKLLMSSLGTKRVPRSKEEAIKIVYELRNYWRHRRQPSTNCGHKYPNITRAASCGSDVEQSILKLYQCDANNEVLDILLTRLCLPVKVLEDLDDFSKLVITIEGAVRAGKNQQKNRAAAAIVAKQETEEAPRATRANKPRKKRQERVARA